jgi:cytochrome b subunit of formate dehydrogenase
VDDTQLVHRCVIRTKRPRFFPLLPVVFLLVWLVAGCGNGSERENRRPSQVLAVPSGRPIAVAPDVISSELNDSVHAELECVDCHVPEQGDLRQPLDYRQGDEIAKSRCEHCHDEAAKNWKASVHGQHEKGGASCSDCHGAHDIYSVTDVRSLVYQRRLPDTCGRCHRNPEVAAKLGIREPEAGRMYVESVHGRLLGGQGLLAAPSCADCHGHNHLIFDKEDPRSTVNPAAIEHTCGQCHQGPAEDYERSIHAKAAAEGKEDAPNCVTCHSAHEIQQPGKGFRLASDAICGKCHQDRLARYFNTYHGRAHDLGSEKVATCYDCHGNHDIRPTSDPESLMGDAKRLQTCRRCHAGAPKNFQSFMAHGDHLDRKNYPLLFWAFVIMTSLIVGTFAIWGLHTLLWFGRSLVTYWRDPADFREQKRKTRAEVAGKVYVRFQPIDRFTHLLVIVSFITLVGTGMPLKFHGTEWARAIFDVLGGPEVAARLHRVGALISFSYLAIHVVTLMRRVRAANSQYRDSKGRFRLRDFMGLLFGPDSPLPNWNDLRDIRAHMAWFLGRGPRPTFDRFTYWEKFDYFAEFWGSAFIGLSGLVMWFPAVFTFVLPGWFVNLAQVVHSQEALLAAGFILTFHFFNGHMRLEKFPMDTVIFSGRITEEELKHERGRQYERLQKDGRLDTLLVQDEWASWKWLFQTIGSFAVVIGIGLAIAIFYAIARYGLR